MSLVGYRFYYDKSFDYLYNECLKNYNHRESLIQAKKRLRMYANLWCRDLVKSGFLSGKVCSRCNTSEKLSVDHIIPISKGGKNIIENADVLCKKCNRLKSDK